MLRAHVSALAALALIPLSAWAQSQNPGQYPGQNPNQQPGQPPAQRAEIFVDAGLGETDNVGLTAAGVC